MIAARRFLYATLALLAACGAPMPNTTGTPREPLVIASDLDHPPFLSVDSTGEPWGRDVELMRHVALELDMPLVWRQMPFDQLLPAVEAGAVDAACATLGITAERSERVLFTRATHTTTIAALVRAEDGAPRTLEELGDRRVAAAAGTTSESAVRQHLPDAQLELGDEGDARSVERLLAGELDAVVLDGPDARRLADADPRLIRIDEPLAREVYALAVPRDRDGLLRAMDSILERLERRGFFAELDLRYGLIPTAPALR